MRSLKGLTGEFLHQLACERGFTSSELLERDPDYRKVKAEYETLLETLKTLLDDKGKGILEAFDDVWCSISVAEEITSYKIGFADAQRIGQLLSTAKFGDDVKEEQQEEDVAASGTGGLA